MKLLSIFNTSNLDLLLTSGAVVLIIAAAKTVALRLLFMLFSGLYILRIILLEESLFLVADLIGGFILIGIMSSAIANSKEIKTYFYRLVSSGSKVQKRLFNSITHSNEAYKESEEIILMSLEKLKKQGEGALIILEKNDDCLNICNNGQMIYGELSTGLLHAIFQKTGPMHDGAVLIRKQTIIGAGFILPLSFSDKHSEQGTRHRAAAGLSEICDARVYVLSEERGTVTIWEDGKLITAFHH